MWGHLMWWYSGGWFGMCEWKEMVTIKNGKLIIDNYTEFGKQLKAEIRLNALLLKISKR